MKANQVIIKKISLTQLQMEKQNLNGRIMDYFYQTN